MTRDLAYNHVQVRMAERSKALRSGRSLLLQAWVRIPLLTKPLLYVDIIKRRSWTLKLQQLFFSTFSSAVCSPGCDELNFLNCSSSVGIKIIMQESFQFSMLKECFQIFISCFIGWLGIMTIIILFGLGNGMHAGLICHPYLIKFQEQFHVLDVSW